MSFCPISTFFATEVAVSVAPLLVFRWLGRLLISPLSHADSRCCSCFRASGDRAVCHLGWTRGAHLLSGARPGRVRAPHSREHLLACRVLGYCVTCSAPRGEGAPRRGLGVGTDSFAVAEAAEGVRGGLTGAGAECLTAGAECLTGAGAGAECFPTTPKARPKVLAAVGPFVTGGDNPLVTK